MQSNNRQNFKEQRLKKCFREYSDDDSYSKRDIEVISNYINPDS